MDDSRYVKVNLEPLRRFSSSVYADLRQKSSGAVRKAIKQWGSIVRSFLQERFNTFSRGGGDWPPLKQKTQSQRRKARKGYKGKERAFSILRDTSTLFGALSPTFANKPGQLEHEIPFGVRIGYGGPARHPKGKATVADIASFHQAGAGHLPKREIIVEPNETVIGQMAAVMDKAIYRLIKDTGSGK